MYDVILYTDKGASHYVKVDKYDLEHMHSELDNENSSNIVEVYCHDGGCQFAFDKSKLFGHTYKEAAGE